jgi:hypothetical protein
MKKSTFILFALAAVILAGCARGHMPQRPKSLPKGRRHGGSVVMLPQQVKTQNVSIG